MVTGGELAIAVAAQIIVVAGIVVGGFWKVYTRVSDKIDNNHKDIMAKIDNDHESISKLDKSVTKLDSSCEGMTKLCQEHRENFGRRMKRLEDLHNHGGKS